VEKILVAPITVTVFISRKKFEFHKKAAFSRL
jgi:hypothetical protein